MRAPTGFAALTLTVAMATALSGLAGASTAAASTQTVQASAYRAGHTAAADLHASPRSATGDSGTPSLALMNAEHDHSMGSTVRARDSQATLSLRAAPHGIQAFSLATTPPGTPGMDVSGWQTLTPADWATAAANGAKFVYVKATEGTDYTSSQFSEQYNDSYAAGLAHGAYHFATPDTSSGAAQATFFVANGGGWSGDGRTLPPLLDIEYNPYGSTCYGLSQAAMISWIASFSSTVQSLTGRLPAIYSTTDWWTQCTGNTNQFAANPLFIARYPNSISDGAGTLPSGWSSYAMWQWADSGTFPGDQDVFNGSVSQLQAFALGTYNPGTASAIPNLGRPVIGNLEAVQVAAGSVTAQGWALDPDTAAPVPVHVYVDSTGADFTANGSRPDVAAAYPGYGADHGFSATMSASAGSHQVCAYGIDVDGPPSLLGCMTVTVP